MSHLGPLSSQDQISVLTGLACLPSSDESESSSSQGRGRFLCFFQKSFCPMNINSWSETLPYQDQDAVSLIVAFPIWVFVMPIFWGSV